MADIDHILERLRQGHLLFGLVDLGQAVLQGFAGHELLHHIVQPLVVVEIKHLDDVGMAQLGNRLGLILEAVDESWVVGKVRVDQLDCYRTLQVRIDGLEHSRHAPLPEHLLDLIAPTEHLANPSVCVHSFLFTIPVKLKKRHNV